MINSKIVFAYGKSCQCQVSDLLCIIIYLLDSRVVLFRWRINILSLGDEEAKALGTDVEKTRLVIIVCATLVTSAAVSISGVIGWVGLVVPHISRMIVGPNYSRLLPMSMIIGASFMLVVDDLSRTIVATEIPLGILTALVGAPLFAYLIKKGLWDGTDAGSEVSCFLMETIQYLKMYLFR